MKRTTDKLMQNKFDLNDRTKQAYQRYAGDGIADMIIGAGFFATGLMMFSDMPFVPVWIVLLLVPASWALKRQITLPRLSEAEATAYAADLGTTTRTFTWVAVLGVSVLAGTLLATVALPRWDINLPQPYTMWGIIAISLIAIFTVLGLLFHAWRFAGYVLLTAATMFFAAATKLDFPFVLMTLGVVILASGLLLAIRFVTTHPRL